MIILNFFCFYLFIINVKLKKKIRKRQIVGQYNFYYTSFFNNIFNRFILLYLIYKSITFFL